MSETVKLIIEIPDYEYKQIKEVFEKSDVVSSAYSYIYHGTLLDDVKAEIEKLTDLNPDYPMDKTIHISKWNVMQILNNIGKGDSK